MEELLNANISFNISPTDYGYTAIQNLIIKYKELLKIHENFSNYSKSVFNDYADMNVELQEKDKIIDLMASFIEVAELDEDIAKTYCLNESCTEIDEHTCKKCIINYFKKKARDENV